jgi:hypothetical protein
MAKYGAFNPLLEENLQELTVPSLVRVATVADAKLLGRSAGTNDIGVLYVAETQGFYLWCDNCPHPVDDDMVFITADGGDTRWELVQKVSRTQGDTGWIDRDGLTLSKLNPTTLRATLTGLGTYAKNSVRFTIPIGNYDIVLSGAAGNKWVYFDTDMTLKFVDGNPTNFSEHTWIANVFWTGTVIGGIQTEFHGIRDTVWHAWAHKYLGTQYTSGLSITTNTQTDNSTDPNDDTVQFLWLTTGVIHDEDTQIDVGTGNWLQTLGSGLTTTTAASIPFFYYNGTAVVGVAANADRYPFLYTGANGTPQWNNGSTLTAATNGQYVVYHYFASPFIDGYTVFARPHNAVFTTLATAQAARPASLIWSSIGEFKHIYSVVFRVNPAWAPVPAHGCKIVSVQDFRLTSSGPAAAQNASTHGALSGLSDPNAHPATAISADATGFDKNLAPTDTNMQLVATAFDEFNALPSNATNASASPDLTNKVAFASATDGQSATFTFDARGVIEFQVDVGTDGGMLISCDYKSTGINALSDPSNLFLATDAGTGIVVTKSANSAAVTVKNRTGTTETIGILAVRSPITAATAWS